MTDSKQFLWAARAAVTGWLRYERRCVLVCWERTPFGGSHNYRPDICGVTWQLRVIEIELKQTVADFKANREKRGLQWRVWEPQQFYFFVPPRLVELIEPLLAEADGLLTFGEPDHWGPAVQIVRCAKMHRVASRLSKWSIARAVMHQTGTLHRAAVALTKINQTQRPAS